MPALRDTQAAFAGALRDAGRPAPAVLKGRSSETPTKRFAVYRNNVAVSLVDAVVAAYPATCKVVGDAFFRSMARVYVDQNPPKSPMMFAYAMNFPQFIRDFEPAKKLPYLPGVAQIEALRRRAYHAADATPVGIDVLSAFDPEILDRVVFTLHPSLGVLFSDFPTYSIWLDNSEFGPAPDPIDLKKGGENTIVLRPALTVETRAVSRSALTFIFGLYRRQTLGAAVEAATQVAEEFDETFDLSAHLAGLFEMGAVVDASTSNAGTSL